MVQAGNSSRNGLKHGLAATPVALGPVALGRVALGRVATVALVAV